MSIIGDNAPAMKDPVKIIFQDVSFQDDKGGRLALRSRSMTFFTSSGERKCNIAWNAIAKVETGCVNSSTSQQHMLKVMNTSGQYLTFGLKNEQDLDNVRDDIKNQVTEYRKGMQAASSLAPAVKHDSSDRTPSHEDSMITFPNFVSERESSAQSLATSGTRSHISNEFRGQEPADEEMSTFTDEHSLVTKASRATSQATRKSARGEEEQSAQISKTSREFNMDDHTIADSTVMSGGADGASYSVISLDPEVGSTYSVDKTTRVPKAEAYDTMERPHHVATFTLVPDEQPVQVDAYHPSNDKVLVLPVAKGEKSMWRSKWFWLSVVLIALLLLGIGIGIGIRMAGDSVREVPVTTVSGLEDTVGSTATNGTMTEVPTALPTEPIIMQAMERPTDTPTDTEELPGCDGIPFGDSYNDRATAISAGSFGGSNVCGLFCGSTNWVLFNTYTGNSNAWFQAAAYEDSLCVADLEHRLKLTVPPGVNYNLHVYKGNSMVPQDSSFSGGDTGVVEEVIVTNADVPFSDESFVYTIEVEYVSGESCEPWTLDFFGHTCM